MSGPEHAAREQQQQRAAPRVAAAPVRRQLTVGAVDDPAEREADEIAERIVASLDDVRRAPAPPTPRIRRSAAADVAPIGAAGGALDDGTTSMLNSQLGRGRSLDADTRGRMEPRLGADLGGVRVHDDAASVELNRRMSAEAFTIGRDIFFSGSAPDTSTTGGAGLLAHELAHVVQQGGASGRSSDPDA